MRLIIPGLVAACLACGVAFAADDGASATDFGTGGWVILSSDDADASRRVAAGATDLVVDGSGRILLLGWASSGDGREVPAAVRLRTNGSIDADWGNQGLARSDSATLRRPIGFPPVVGALLPDGRLVVAADMQRAGLGQDLCTFIQVYTTTGAIDSGFDTGLADDCTSFGQPPATVPTNGYFGGPSVAVGATSITVRGVAGPGAAGTGPNVLARMGFDGSPIAGFGNGGNAVVGLFTLTDAAAGTVGLCASGGGVGVGRLTDAGSLDPTFGAGGCNPLAFGATPMQLASIAIDQAGRIAVAATPRLQPFNPTPMDCIYCVARHTATGLPDASFNASGSAPGGPGYLPLYPGIVQDYLTSARDLVGRGRGGLAVGGTVRLPSAPSTTSAMVVALRADGILDTRFGNGGFGPGTRVLDHPAFAARQNYLVHLARAPGGDLVVAAIGVGGSPLFIGGITRLVDDAIFVDDMEPAL